LPAGPSQTVVLPLDKSRIISLPRDARDVLVTNPAIADVVVKTRQRVYLMGKGVGQTDVYFFDNRGEQILRLDLSVSLDLTALKATLGVVLPNDGIEVSASGNSILLTGKASSAGAAENARRLARQFVKNDADVINMVEIVGEEQVLLQVHISEMQRTIVKQLGINTTFGNSHSTFTVIPRRGTQTDTFSTLFFDFASIFGLRGTFTSWSAASFPSRWPPRTTRSPSSSRNSGCC
jgi:pilus assembly protein CpaC